MHISGARTSEARGTLAVLLAIVGIVAGVLAACGGSTTLPPAATAQPTETRASVSVQPSATAAPLVALARVPGAAPAIAVADDTPRRTAGSFFPIGVFEDANLLDGDTARFETMIGDLQSHGLDTIMFTNNAADRDAPLLAVSDKLDFGVFMLPAHDLVRDWWRVDVPENSATAQRVAAPIVRQLSRHPSLKGYIVADEPRLESLNKVMLMTQALHQFDRARPALPILTGIDRVGPIFAAAQPEVLLIDVYPVGTNNPICDFTMTDFGYDNLDFVGYVRQVTRNKPAETPLWMILQTHSFMKSLRAPTPTEVRAQQWLAIGEGATGIFWFVYSSQQGWVGLADNPALYQEVSALARRVGPLREVLLRTRKVADTFTIAGGKNPYVSTLASLDGAKSYVVAVNRDCERTQQLSIGSPVFKVGRLKDLESSQTYALGSPILFQPGDGRIFEYIGERAPQAYAQVIR